MRDIIFLTDQNIKVVSGPGVFTGLMKQLSHSMNFNLKVVCFENLLNFDFRFTFFNKVRTFLVILLYSFLASYYSSLKRKNLVLVNSFYHSLFSVGLDNQVIFVNDLKFRESFIRKILALRILRSCRLVIANSDFVDGELKSLGINKTIVINKCLDENFTDLDIRKKTSRKQELADEKISLLFVKSDWKVGGLKDIVSSIGSSNNGSIFLRIVGIPESDLTKVHGLCQKFLDAGSYEVLPNLGRQEMLSVYLSSHALINNCEIEAFCLSALEAVATNCVVIAVDHKNVLNSLMLIEKFGVSI